MKRRVITLESRVKTAILKKNNWNKTGYKNNTCYYRHNKRKRVGLHVNMKDNTGTFWDERMKKMLSFPKKIKWE
jgi:hypothetical protein